MPRYHGILNRKFIGWEFRVYEKEVDKRPELISEGFAFTFKRAHQKKEGTVKYLNGEISHEEWLDRY